MPNLIFLSQYPSHFLLALKFDCSISIPISISVIYNIDRLFFARIVYEIIPTHSLTQKIVSCIYHQWVILNNKNINKSKKIIVFDVLISNICVISLFAHFLSNGLTKYVDKFMNIKIDWLLLLLLCYTFVKKDELISFECVCGKEIRSRCFLNVI